MGSINSKNDSWTSIQWDFSIAAGKKIGPKGRYTLDHRIGGGNFGEVYKAKDNLNGDFVAIKFLTRGHNLNPVYVRREIMNHRSMSHPHIIEFKEVFLTDKHLCIVMDFAAGGNLQSYVTKHRCLSEDKARWFFQQLILALDYCHKQDIVIRDIKLSNILLDEHQTKIMLCDFGFSKHCFRDSRSTTFLGTDPYLPPEMLVKAFGGVPGDSVYDAKKFDIWTCGIVLFTMLMGRNPFYNIRDPAPSRRKQMYGRMINFKKRSKTMKTQTLSTSKEAISERCTDFLDRILDLNPATRISVEGIMKHSWFSENLPPTFLEYNETQGLSKDRSLYLSKKEIEEMIGLARDNFDFPMASDSRTSLAHPAQPEDQPSREILVETETFIAHRRAFSVGMVE
ncbi:hypothetical protein BSKO_05748 [Bryopsis sp. KO-2023]|nr:hypothetical protein BSKO_05748 [Bryopsis sp. KO-2023]